MSTWLLAVLSCASASSQKHVSRADNVDFAASPSPVGAGARAAGMADAFVAVADDATAASWNPAGLVQLEVPEISAVGAHNLVLNYPSADETQPQGDEGYRFDQLDLNFIGVVYPLPPFLADRNITVSLSYQQKYDFTRDWQGRVVYPATGNEQHYDLRQEGGLGAVTPALAVEITKTLSLGVAVNLWRDTPFQQNGFTQDVAIESTLLDVTTRQTRYKNFTGENVVVGALWNFAPHWNLALRYDTGFTGDADFSLSGIDGGRRQLAFPPTFAAGVACRPSDRFTAAFDITRTNWDHFYIKTGDGTKISMVDASGGSADDPRTEFETTTTVRLGFEYLFLPKVRTERLDRLWSARWGLFYDQEPASGDTVDGEKSGDPDSFYGITCGTGLLVAQRFNFDVAYQFRYGANVNSDNFRGVPGYAEDFYQHRFLISAVVYLGGRR